MGRPKKPATAKRREGNPGKRKLAGTVAVKLEKPPPLPAGLKPKGKELWHKVTAHLVALGRLSAVDLEAVRVLCDTWQLYHDLARYGNISNALFKTKSGYMQEHPGWRMRQKAADRLEKLWRKFGLTPLDRVGLDIQLGGDEDEDEDFERKR